MEMEEYNELCEELEKLEEYTRELQKLLEWEGIGFFSFEEWEECKYHN